MIVELERHLQVQADKLGHVAMRVRVLGAEHTANREHLNDAFKYSSEINKQQELTLTTPIRQQF